MQVYFNDPTHKKEIIERNRKTAANAERNKKIGNSHAKRYIDNPELREKASQESKKRWDDSNYKERVTNSMLNAAQKKATAVLQVETGIIFPSMEEAANSVGGNNKSSICNCCKGKKITASGYHWRYAEDTIEDWTIRRSEYLSSLEKPRRSGHTKIPVICINNGIRYESCKEAAAALNISASSISEVCLGRQKTAKGLQFKYAEEKNKNT